jgi:hypothetical protein
MNGKTVWHDITFEKILELDIRSKLVIANILLNEVLDETYDTPLDKDLKLNEEWETMFEKARKDK